MDELNKALFEYCLRLGDCSLIAGQRLAEWCGHGPILEEDIAMTNISLDLIGEARGFYNYASVIEGKGRTEDDFAYLRDTMEFRNLLLVEQPNVDFAVTMMKQFFFSAYLYFLYKELQSSKDKTITAIAEKSLKEVTYHLRHSSQWILRLGDGTDESSKKVQSALNDLWMYTGDLFDMDETDTILIEAGIAADLNKIKQEWNKIISDILTEAKLIIPPADTWMAKGSRSGKHSEYLGYILAEMQALPREYPDAKW
jgi:ring-1,2-phenylacetyl-CoA epoxidase subunit PaaC